MLARAADSLYRVSRYLERADFLARPMEAPSLVPALPAAYAAAGDEWKHSARARRETSRPARLPLPFRRKSAPCASIHFQLHVAVASRFAA